jgi:RNA polymerase sigma-70 factor (ECF subfamily)
MVTGRPNIHEEPSVLPAVKGTPPQPARRKGPVSDHSLIHQIRAGDDRAATELYHRYAVRLKCLAAAQLSARLARRIEPEDLVQSVFTTFFRGVSAGDYSVPREGDLWRLLLVMLLNNIRNQAAFCYAAKRNARITQTVDFLGKSAESLEPQTDDLARFFELVVRDALELLPPAHKSAVELRLQGYEVSEIAQRLHRSKRTTERLLEEAREYLSRHLLEEDL